MNELNWYIVFSRAVISKCREADRWALLASRKPPCPVLTFFKVREICVYIQTKPMFHFDYLLLQMMGLIISYFVIVLQFAGVHSGAGNEMKNCSCICTTWMALVLLKVVRVTLWWYLWIGSVKIEKCIHLYRPSRVNLWPIIPAY